MGKRIALILVLACVCAAFAAPVAVPAQRNTLSSLDSGVLSQLNQIRVQHGLVPLKLSARLTDAAAEHSRQMGVDGYFEHTSADGTAFWKRIGHWYPTKGYHYWSVGENLLWSSPDVSALGAMQLWMNSPEHRANILDPRWREIGIAAMRFDAAPGTYRGLAVTIITTDFGVRH